MVAVCFRFSFLIALGIVVLGTGCQEEPVQTQRAVAQVSEPTPIIEPTKTERELAADEHLANASDYYRNRGELGLALEEVEQALAEAPNYEPAMGLRQKIAPPATRAAATAVARAQAEATSEARAAATATAAGRIQRYISGPPKGGWTESRTGISVGVANIGYERSFGFQSAGTGNRFVGISLIVANTGTTSFRVSPLDVTLIDNRGTTYPYHSATYDCAQPFPGVDVRPSNNAQGCVFFLTPQSVAPVKVVYQLSAFLPSASAVEIDLLRDPDF